MIVIDMEPHFSNPLRLQVMFYMGERVGLVSLGLVLVFYVDV